MLRDMMTHAGHQVHEASDGKEALQTYQDCRGSVVILDIVMPEMEGLETITELKRIDPDVRIIAISGGGRFEPASYLEVAVRLGALRAFAKPVDNSDLLATVSTVAADPKDKSTPL
jgi:YesN/AraC family two-component response regulator